MSYCRFSSDNWKSDVYVYEDVSGGFTTHVAKTRKTWYIIPDAPLSLLLWGGILGIVWRAWHRAHMWMVGRSPTVKIGGLYDGADFNDDTALDCVSTLVMLRAAGYNVPQYVIDSLGEEALANPERLI